MVLHELGEFDLYIMCIPFLRQNSELKVHSVSVGHSSVCLCHYHIRLFISYYGRISLLSQ
jgi:hypothetical protein